MGPKTRKACRASLESWGVSLRGTVRDENQDSFLNWPERSLWAVADGVASGEQGGVASRMVMEKLLRVERPDTLDAHVANIGRALEEANRQLHAWGADAGKLTASTAVALCIHEGRAVCLWAGDSRCFLLRGGALYQCTRDHTLRQEKIDSGELTRFEAFRMVKGNILTNAVGVKDELTLGKQALSLRAGDRFLLCSDGLTAVLSLDALGAHLSGSSARDALRTMTEALSDLHQPDNITCIVVFVSELERV
ncbi:MAG: serine/threonine-protein phosphatase [Deltaproteobacteria bacterium]|jgi:serine/threonine protein phosphatase PrpC|nr:serine/threonine-protein phosphatase [Deltaproteobacteria bacterium]